MARHVMSSRRSLLSHVCDGERVGWKVFTE